MRVQVSPRDDAFPQLVRLSDPGYLGERLDAGTARTIAPIRYRPKYRHVLRYDGADATVFVKVYKTAEEAGRSYRIAMLVADRVAAAAPWVQAAQPLGWNEQDAFVIYAQVHGTPLSRRLARRMSITQHLDVTGRAMRALHSDGHMPATDLRPHSFEAEVGKVRGACEHFHTFAPALGRRVEVLLERVQHIHEQLPASEPTFVHGDLKCDHLWATPDGLALMDFDTCSLTDPAHDLGKLLADLQWWHDRWHHPHGPADAHAAFLDAYSPDGATLRRARAYEALILTKITAHRIWLFERDWVERHERLITLVEGVLNRLEKSARSAPHAV